MRSASRLEIVSIARPCSKSWSELVGDDTRRFCSTCDLHVTNLSALGRNEAEDFLARSTGRVCVAFVRDARGRALPRPALASSRRGSALVRGLSRAAGFLLGLVCLLPGCRPAPAQEFGEIDPEPCGPGVETTGGETGHIVGKISTTPKCTVEDERLLMGEMALPPSE